MGNGSYCSAINCNNCKAKNRNKSFFRFPLNSERSRRWVINCRREDLLSRDPIYLYKNCFICSDHFESHFFLNDLRNRLQPNAIPTIFNVPNPPKLSATKRRKDFRSRKNIDSRRAWINAIRRKNFKPSRWSVLCSDHFQEKDLDRSSLSCVRVREGAVPSIFPGFPAHLEKNFTSALPMPISLCLKESGLQAEEYGVWSLEDIPIGIRFGPYQGLFVYRDDCGEKKGFKWKVKRNCNQIMDLDYSNERRSNWLLYINHARNTEEQNLIMVQNKSGVYYITSNFIPVNTELLVM